jgi:hypothetical protein
MAAKYTLDDLSKEEYAKAEKGIKAFRAGPKTKAAEHELYAVLTNAGLEGESADKYINMELESGDEGGGW